MRLRLQTCIWLLSFLTAVSHAKNNSPLTLVEAYSLDGVTGLHPSGLAKCGEDLLFVSDKHDHEIFQIVMASKDTTAQQIQVKPYVTIDSIPQPPSIQLDMVSTIERQLGEWLGFSGGYDWEGLACDEDGHFYLASEYYVAVLKVNAQGDAKWITPSFYQAGTAAGLFKKQNAFIEAITLYDNAIWLAAEREPRGIVKVPSDAPAEFIRQSGAELSDQQLPWDFTGLDSWNQQLYVLERNHDQVCLLIDGQTEHCRSFAQVKSEWSFESDPYGTAEGLVVQGEDVWIIFDNNEKPRKGKTDNRPILLKFKITP